MYVTAHIGNVPIEEWLPFVFPVLALYLYGRHKTRQRREAVARLPDPRELLDERTIRDVVGRWSRAGHGELSAEHVPLLYPPGPEGMTAAELARRIHGDSVTVERLLEELDELGYLELEGGEDTVDRRAWLTVEGYDLVNVTEDALLATPTVKR